jgi:Uma2 family endonuclease
MVYTPDIDLLSLPTGDRLPSSDDTPVDNEDQNFLPNLLLFALLSLWSDRTDWYFAADMAVYHTTGVSPKVPVVPDGFLSLGVPRFKGDTFRRSYVVWEEDWVVPSLVLEVVSHSYGEEYEDKMALYTKLGVLYYVIYNPLFWQRDSVSADLSVRHQPFEVYRLEEGEYKLQIGEPYWMPEIGLGIGRGRYQNGRLEREVLYWFNDRGQRHLTPEEQAQLELERYRRHFGTLPALDEISSEINPEISPEISNPEIPE